MIGGDHPPEELSQFTGFLMHHLGRRSGACFAEALAPLGFHPREFGVMTVIAGRPGVTQQELAGTSGVDPSTMVALLDDLERRGLVERGRVPADRRKYAISLTTQGKRTLSRLQRAAAAAGESFFAPLGPVERATLQRLLRKLAGFGG